MSASRRVAIESLDRAIECAEKNMIPQLAECLSWNNDYDGECYMVLAEYGNLLDSSTRRKIVEGQTAVNELIEEFRTQYSRRPSMMRELNKLR